MKILSISRLGVARRDGFSLMEVSMAVLLVGVALLALFSLFPLGLRESDLAVADTHETQFAEHILSSLEGNAADILEWPTWRDSFNTEVVKEVYPVSTQLSATGLNRGKEFPEGNTDRQMRYELTIERVAGTGSRVWQARLWVKSGRYGNFEEKKQLFVSQFVYQGM